MDYRNLESPDQEMDEPDLETPPNTSQEPNQEMDEPDLQQPRRGRPRKKSRNVTFAPNSAGRPQVNHDPRRNVPDVGDLGNVLGNKVQANVNLAKQFDAQSRHAGCGTLRDVLTTLTSTKRNVSSTDDKLQANHLLQDLVQNVNNSHVKKDIEKQIKDAKGALSVRQALRASSSRLG